MVDDEILGESELEEINERISSKINAVISIVLDNYNLSFVEEVKEKIKYMKDINPNFKEEYYINAIDKLKYSYFYLKSEILNFEKLGTPTLDIFSGFNRVLELIDYIAIISERCKIDEDLEMYEIIGINEILTEFEKEIDIIPKIKRKVITNAILDYINEIFEFENFKIHYNSE